MTFRIEIVDPLSAAAMASRVLRAAWKPPCLDYSPEYLAWQFGFPGALKPTVAVGFLDGLAVGCAAVTQRGLVFEGSHLDAYVLSFVAVDPIARGQGLAASLYSHLLKTLSAEVPVIAFAEPGAAGEKLLIKAFADASFTSHALSACRAIGYLARPVAAADAACTAALARNYEDFTSTVPAADKGTIWSRPTPQHWEHYQSDPRSRVCIVVRHPEGLPIGSAMIVTTDIMSAQGLQHVPMLESVCLWSQPADGLRAIFSFAAGRYGTGTTIVASNLSYLDGAVIKAAGARALPSSFNAYIFFKTRRTGLEKASSLNLEVI